MEGQQRSMLHADGPQGGAINLQKNHTEYTTANLNSVELFGLAMQKTRIKITEKITVAKMTSMEQVFIISILSKMVIICLLLPVVLSY